MKKSGQHTENVSSPSESHPREAFDVGLAESREGGTAKGEGVIVSVPMSWSGQLSTVSFILRTRATKPR